MSNKKMWMAFSAYRFFYSTTFFDRGNITSTHNDEHFPSRLFSRDELHLFSSLVYVHSKIVIWSVLILDSKVAWIFITTCISRKIWSKMYSFIMEYNCLDRRASFLSCLEHSVKITYKFYFKITSWPEFKNTSRPSFRLEDFPMNSR